MARPVSVQPVNFSLIRHVIKKRGLKFQDVADDLELSASHFSEMLAGTRKLNDERLAGLSNLLGVHANYFRTSIGRLAIQKVEADLTDWSLSPERHDVKETKDYLDVTERMGYIDFAPELPDAETFQQWDFWKRDAILPFLTENAERFWNFDGNQICIRGPARCGKSTLIFEWVITTMFQNSGMEVLATRAFGVDLHVLRKTIVDLCKYRFSDPLSSVKVIGGTKFHTVEINGGNLYLAGIDRPGSQLGAGYDLVIHSQAELVKLDKIEEINSRCSPSSGNWIEDGVAKARVIYDVNPNRLDHWLEAKFRDEQKPLFKIDFTFEDHPAYVDEKGSYTQLYYDATDFLKDLTGVRRERYFKGVAANPEGAIFELDDCHKLSALPADFQTANNFYRGFDFGLKDPNVILWFGHHRHTGDLTVFREWRMTGTDTIQMGEAAKLFTKEKILATVIDEPKNAENPDKKGNLGSILQSHCGIATTLANKGPNTVSSGITLAQHRLQNARDGEPGGLYFYDNPVVRDPEIIRRNEPLTTIEEAEVYSWEENSDKPVDQDNHGWDIIRYILDYLEHSRLPVGFGGGGVKRKGRL